MWIMMNRRDLLKAAAAGLLITPAVSAQQPPRPDVLPPGVRPAAALAANIRMDVLVSTMCTSPDNGRIPGIEYGPPYFRMYVLIENRNTVPVTVEDLFIVWTERGVERDRSDVGGVEGGPILPGERRFVAIRIDKTPDVRWVPERMRATLALGNVSEAQLTPDQRGERAAIVTAQSQLRIRDIRARWPFGADYRIDNRNRHACLGVAVLAVSKLKTGRITDATLVRFPRIPPGVHSLSTEMYEATTTGVEPPQMVEFDFVTLAAQGMSIETPAVVIHPVGIEGVVDRDDVTPGA
jgi:hypothetical protein